MMQPHYELYRAFDQVNAAIVLHKSMEATADDILSYCKKNLAAFKIPKRIFFADTVPRTATGKIQRRFVAEHFLSTEKEATSG